MKSLHISLSQNIKYFEVYFERSDKMLESGSNRKIKDNVISLVRELVVGKERIN